MSDLTIRPCTTSDAEAVATLTGQLGYTAELSEIRARLQHLAADDRHEIFVACLPAGTIVGWIDVGIVYHLQTGPFADIGGLVVEEAERSRGVGRQLVERAEAWARNKGLKRVRVRSNVKRTDAHRFYERENYVRTKTSAVFEKQL